jgi:hypothetical protein
VLFTTDCAFAAPPHSPPHLLPAQTATEPVGRRLAVQFVGTRMRTATIHSRLIWKGSIGLSMSCWMLAVLIAMLASWIEQPSAAPQAATATTAPAAVVPGTTPATIAVPVIATGCLIREPAGSGAPPVGHEAGGASELALAQAILRHPDGRALNTAPRSAVPGSSPAGFGSGTTSEPVPGGRRPSSGAIDQAFWLAGAKAVELSRYIGKQVEITGTLDDNAQTASRTASAAPNADAGSSPNRRSAASPTADAAAVAHPSAPLRVITVGAFRVLTESCS